MTTAPFDIIDVHMHAWPTDDSTMFKPHERVQVDEQVFQDTLAQMDRLGISKGVISGPNLVTNEWCRRAPSRFIPSWLPDPDPADPEQEADRFEDAVVNQGFRGLGELMMAVVGVPNNDERFFPLYSICEERNLPVFFHTGLGGPDFFQHRQLAFRVDLCNPLLLEDVAAAFPRLRIIMAHMSFPFTEQAAYMLYAHSNVYLDVAVVNWILGKAGFHHMLRQIVETVGPDKIMFGSDQMSMPQMISVAVSAVQEADFLSYDDKRKLLGDNARRLLGIDRCDTSQDTT